MSIIYPPLGGGTISFNNPELALLLSGSGVAENVSAATKIGNISVVGSSLSGWTFILLDTVSAHLQILNGNELWSTAGTTFDYEANTLHDVLIEATTGNATGGSPTLYRRFDMTVRLLITNDATDDVGNWASYDANLVTNTMSGGAALSDFGLVIGDLGTYGLKAVSPKTHIGKYSMDVGNALGWAITGAGVTVTAGNTYTDASGTFKTAYMANSAGGFGWKSTGTVGSRPAGVVDTHRIRFGPKPGQPSAVGYKLTLDNDGTQIFSAGGELLGSPPANGIPSNVTIVSQTLGSYTDGGAVVHNWQELIVKITRGSSSVPSEKWETYNSGNMEMHAWDTIQGPASDAYVATAATTVVTSGKTLPTSGAIDTILNGTSGAICLWVFNITNNLPALLLTNGATTGLEHTLLDMADYCNARAEGASLAPLKKGGALGLSIIGLTWNASGYKLQYNGGPIKTVATPLTAGAKRVIAANLDAWVERVLGATTYLSDATLTVATSKSNKTYPWHTLAVGQPAELGLSTTTFWNYYPNLPMADIVRKRLDSNGDNFATIPAISYQDNASRFNQLGPNGLANLMRRYVFDTTNTGTGSVSQINGEDQVYFDPQFPWATGWIDPMTKQAGTGALMIECIKNTNQPSAVQAQIPFKKNTSAILLYGSAMLTSAGKGYGGYEQKFGHFGSRFTMPSAGRWSFTAPMWTVPGLEAFYNNRNEMDFPEQFGFLASDHTIRHIFFTIHANGNSGSYNFSQQLLALDTGLDLSQGSHTVEMIWKPGALYFAFNGIIVCQFLYDPAVYNFDTYAHMFNSDYAYGADFIGHPTDSLSGAADGLRMLVWHHLIEQANV